MLPIVARAIYIKQEAAEDPRSMQRIARLLPFIHCNTNPRVVDDAAWHRLVVEEHLNDMPRHGRDGEGVEPVVILNQYLYQHTPEQRAQRKAQFPALFRPEGNHDPYSGYGGWDWRSMGDETYRRRTGLVCQPGYALHSIWGCHFRCTYCSFGHVAHVYVNLEDWVERIRAGLQSLEKAPGQKLFQWDNGADVVCWEPEYGATRMLVELFAAQPDKYLELYVGKSDYVDYLLEYEHRGHTVCCWSLGTETQCCAIEQRTAGMEARLAAARKCEEAGYPVRIRLSPMVPIVGWEQEVRHMLRRMFEMITPQVLTIEPLRYYDYPQLVRDFPEGLLNARFLEAMRQLPASADAWQRQEFPDDLRLEMYRVVLDEAQRLSPATPVAFCREKRSTWETLQGELARMGQYPDDYVCNCGPRSAGCDPRLATRATSHIA